MGNCGGIKVLVKDTELLLLKKKLGSCFTENSGKGNRNLWVVNFYNPCKRLITDKFEDISTSQSAVVIFNAHNTLCTILMIEL